VPSFHYRAARPDGTIIETNVEGETPRAIRLQLEAQGLLVLDLSGSGGTRQGISLRTRQRPLALRDFLVFNQEFLALVKAGLPMLRCFDLLNNRTGQGGFQQALQAVRESIRGGSAISEAMAMHPIYFPELYQASIRAGEQAGNLPEVLKRYIDYLKMIIGVREKVVKATIYPLFLLGFGILVTFGLLVFVLPSFAEVYQESRVELPWATQLLLDVTNSAGQWILGIAIVLGLTGAWVYWWRTTSSRAMAYSLVASQRTCFRPLVSEKSSHSSYENPFNNFGWRHYVIVSPSGHGSIHAEQSFCQSPEFRHQSCSGRHQSFSRPQKREIPSQFDIGNDRSRRNNRIIGNHAL
jgi:type II secretory pathway component PulF